MKFSNLINFLSSFNDRTIIKKIKDKLINFNFADRHLPFKETKKIYLNQKYFINNFHYDIYDYSHVSQLIYSSYEKDIFSYYLNSFKEGENFIDIGSNIGVHSFFILKYLKPNHVISIEPQSLCIYLQNKTLKNNKELNPDKINFINSAIAYKETNIKIFRNNSGSGTLVDDFGSDYLNPNNLNTMKISNISIEDVFKNLSNRVINIKIDTQGSEINILKEIHNSNFIKNVGKIIFEINLNEIDELKTILKSFTKNFILTNLKNSEISIDDLDLHIKRCLVLSNKLLN